MGDKTIGLYEKFHVERVDGSSERGGKHYQCEYFVLDMNHDEHAYAAVKAYADSCEAEYPLLAADLRKKYEVPASAPSASVAVAWALTYAGEFNGNIFDDEAHARSTFARLQAKFPNDKRELVPLYTNPLAAAPGGGLTREWMEKREAMDDGYSVTAGPTGEFMDKTPWHNPEQLLEAWTATDYEGDYPPYVNVTQVGPMCRLTFRAPIKKDGSMGDAFTMVVNTWTLNKIGDVLKAASTKFETGFEDRVFEDHKGYKPERP